MRLIRLIARELLGLFVDDEFLAIFVLVLIAIAAAMTFWSKVPNIYVGLLIVAGCPIIVAGSLMRALRR